MSNEEMFRRRHEIALIIQFEEGGGNLEFTRGELESLLTIPEQTPPEASEYRCKVCGVPMDESFSEGKYVNSALETDRWEEYHGIQAMNGYPAHCITYNDTFGWNEHVPETI